MQSLSMLANISCGFLHPDYYHKYNLPLNISERFLTQLHQCYGFGNDKTLITAAERGLDEVAGLLISVDTGIPSDGAEQFLQQIPLREVRAEKIMYHSMVRAEIEAAADDNVNYGEMRYLALSLLPPTIRSSQSYLLAYAVFRERLDVADLLRARIEKPVSSH